MEIGKRKIFLVLDKFTRDDPQGEVLYIKFVLEETKKNILCPNTYGCGEILKEYIFRASQYYIDSAGKRFELYICPYCGLKFRSK